MRAEEFLVEQESSVRSRFEKMPSATGKLVIFDIDDTLVNTDTKVNVVRDGKIIKRLNSHDFTHYKLGPGEEFDFGAFSDAREFFANARPIAPMIRQLKADIATGNRVIMVTARSDFNDRDIFLSTFEKWGIDMSKVHVYRAGNIQMKVATEKKKKIILRHLLGKTHYDKIIMYDDAVPNLDAFLSLAQEYPWSKFYAWHVDREGGATEYHRSGASLGENTVGGRTATGKQVLKYILKTQGESEFRPFLQKEILAIPQWELVNVPLSSLHIPDLDYDEGEDYEVKADPYGRVLFVDFDYAGEVSARNIDRLPIVIDSQGHIFDGNHRAWAAAELMNRSTIPAWRPAKKSDNFTDGQPVIDMLEEGCIELSRMLEERPHLIENYEGWAEIQSLLNRIVGEEPVIGQHYSVLNLTITPPGRFLVQQGVRTPVKLTNILDRGPYVQYEFDVSGRIFLFPEDHRAGDRLSRTFLYSTRRALEKTQSFIAMSLRDWEIRDRINENFADGKNPGRKGLSKRVGVSQKMSISKLKKIASTATGERRRMAQWNLNMKRGRKKS